MIPALNFQFLLHPLLHVIIIGTIIAHLVFNVNATHLCRLRLLRRIPILAPNTIFILIMFPLAVVSVLRRMCHVAIPMSIPMLGVIVLWLCEIIRFIFLRIPSS